MPRDGKLSVAAIIPCYNGAEFLAEAIKSVQSQTRPVDEILVVDDGSTDESAAIARDLGAEVLSLGMNLGAGPARNHGLRHVRSDLVAWLDADDYWLDHHVATLVPLGKPVKQLTRLKRRAVEEMVVRGTWDGAPLSRD